MVKLKKIQSWVFDLDNTLYPASTNLFAQVDVRMRDFISQYLGLDAEAARRLQKSYFHECGTTLRGLMTKHDMDPGPYLDYVHDIDISPVAASPMLDEALSALDGKKYIFTNASTAHAERVMERLGVANRFDGIFDIKDADYMPKPAPSIYDDFIKKFGVDPQSAVMVEDMARNLKPAFDLGMQCVWVKTDSDWGKPDGDAEYIHHETDDLVAWLQGI